MYETKVKHSAESRQELKIKPVCVECGSEEIYADYSCRWDKKIQRWIGEDMVGDHYWCASCDDEFYEIDEITIPRDCSATPVDTTVGDDDCIVVCTTTGGTSS